MRTGTHVSVNIVPATQQPELQRNTRTCNTNWLCTVRVYLALRSRAQGLGWRGAAEQVLVQHVVQVQLTALRT